MIAREDETVEKCRDLASEVGRKFEERVITGTITLNDEE